MKYNINVMISDVIRDNIDKKIYNKISDVVSGVVTFNKLSFIALLVLVVRLVVIMLEI